MSYCCENMNNFTKDDNGLNSELYQNPDVLIVYIPKYDEYGLIIHDGEESSIEINYCPWCSTKLPISKRNLWFDELENLGVEEFSEENIPNDFKSDNWWKSL
ncbi:MULTISPECIES: DUF6980 family protein [Enterococcus]|uniref:DUF6980 family protein n=1 Tax=Enterococcus TaxID=1350 RepID=UPI000A33CEB0|nr:hypothetical protein [Enterococcus faecalis]OTP16915.1 hypothetical protein A5830_000681 [Enterococcus faecalis]